MPMPTFRRVVHGDHASALSGRAEADPLVREAILLAPLHRIQVVCDQMARKVEDDLHHRRSLGLDGLSAETVAYLADERKAIARHAELAALVHGTAKAMVADLDNQLADLTGVPLPVEPARRRGRPRKVTPEVPVNEASETEAEAEGLAEAEAEGDETEDEDGGLI